MNQVPKPVECWILKIVWLNGDTTLLPSKSNTYDKQAGVYWEIVHPITEHLTFVRIDQIRQVGYIRGTITQKPKGNPLNDDDHYDNPEN